VKTRKGQVEVERLQLGELDLEQIVIPLGPARGLVCEEAERLDLGIRQFVGERRGPAS